MPCLSSQGWREAETGSTFIQDVECLGSALRGGQVWGEGKAGKSTCLRQQCVQPLCPSAEHGAGVGGC